MENPEIQWRIQMERFIPVEVFRKKSNTFFPFLPKRPKFSVPFVSGLLVPGLMSRELLREGEKFTSIL